MTIILHHLMFLGAYFSIIIATGQMLQKNKQTVSYIYSVSFLSMGLWIFHICSYSTGLFSDCYHVNLLLIPFAFISAPVMSLRYRWIIGRKLIKNRRFYIYMVPAILSLPVIAYPYISSDFIIQPELTLSIPVFSQRFLDIPLYYKVIQSLYFLPKLYLVITMTAGLISLSGMTRKMKNNPVSKAGFIFAVMIITSTTITGMGDLIGTELIYFGVLYVNATYISVFLFAQRNPDYNRVIKTEMKKIHYEHSKIQGLNINEVLLQLTTLMEEEKAFALEGITLRHVADELNITTHQLSELLNLKLKKNFNSYINDYRIKEAKVLLRNEPDRTITSIGIAVGFNSNSAFSTIFSRITGKSPKEYRKSSKKSP